MGVAHFAPRVTQIAESQTDSQILSGTTVKIWGMVLTNTAAAAQTITFEHADDGSANFAIEMPPNSIEEVNTPWRADRGLQITTGADTRVTVFHSQSGG